MDRSVLESDPHRVLEGMAIAGYAIGASQGYIYVRAEYPLAVKRLKTAIEQAERMRPAGQEHPRHALQLRPRDPPGRRRVRLRRRDRADRLDRRQARHAAPAPAVSRPKRGLWGKPTLINNVETFANVPPIIRNGGEWFAGIGTEKSKGTKVFALAGKISNTGLVEVPMGMTLREIVYDIGGGIPDGKQVQGRADRRPLRRLHPRAVPRHAGRLRLARQGRLDHGLRRHDRHGRDLLHGRRRQVLHGLLHGRVVRQVRPVPRRHQPDVRHAEQDHRRQRHAEDICTARGAVRPGASSTSLCGLGRPRPIRC